MRGAEIGVFAGALVFSVMTAYAVQRPMPDSRAEAAAAREALLDSADLRVLHNQVYARVGEGRWEAQVKPAFLRRITLETVRETGNPVPAWEDVVDWVRAHPEETRRFMKDAAGE